MSNDKIKILMVLGTLNYGGAEIFCLNFVKSIDKDKYQVDFAVTSLTKSDIEKELESMGCKIHIIPKFNGVNVSKYKKSWKLLLENNHYDIVHGHASGAMSLYLSVAKKMGCATIAHSHSGSTRGSLIEKTVKKIWAKGVGKNADYWFACSELAAKRLFGKKYKNSNKYHFIPNGIDCDKFKFNLDKRNNIRKSLNINENTFVIGHVGSFTKPKNHEYILSIFEEILKDNSNSILVLCGDGPLKQNIADQVDKNGLLQKVIFTGNVGNVNEYYSSFDAMLFPSIFEGLPVSLVEAQASGLSILCSESITKEIYLTKHIYHLPQNVEPKKWSDFLMNSIDCKYERNDDFYFVKSSPFTIENTTKIITKIYDDIMNH